MVRVYESVSLRTLLLMSQHVISIQEIILIALAMAKRTEFVDRPAPVDGLTPMVAIRRPYVAQNMHHEDVGNCSMASRLDTGSPTDLPELLRRQREGKVSSILVMP